MDSSNGISTFRQVVNATSNGTVRFQLKPPRRIGMFQALSLTGQRALINITEGGLHQENITLNFTSPESDVDYMVAVYSDRIDGVHDFRMGEFHLGDSLLHT